MLDLFSGIGGFSLGCEATKGFETIAFCEIDPFCRKVLAKHWPGVPIFEDITKLGEGELNDLGNIDVICGGFPCQDISCAGKGAGIHAARSGLWWEMLRIIRLVRPQYVLVENVAALLNRGLDEVLGSLAESGYDAEWAMLSASDFGAPHTRRRLFGVAHTNGVNGKEGMGDISKRKKPIFGGERRNCFGNWILPTSGIDRSNDGLSRKLDADRIKALGNAICPPVAQYVAECVLAYEKEI